MMQCSFDFKILLNQFQIIVDSIIIKYYTNIKERYLFLGLIIEQFEHHLTY